MNRRQRDGSLSAAQVAQISADFAAVCATEYQLVDVSAQVVDRAWRLLEQHALRAYDAVQLASALLADTVLRATGAASLTFLAADDRLLAAAQLEGLVVDNANLHP